VNRMQFLIGALTILLCLASAHSRAIFNQPSGLANENESSGWMSQENVQDNIVGGFSRINSQEEDNSANLDAFLNSGMNPSTDIESFSDSHIISIRSSPRNPSNLAPANELNLHGSAQNFAPESRPRVSNARIQAKLNAAKNIGNSSPHRELAQ